MAFLKNVITRKKATSDIKSSEKELVSSGAPSDQKKRVVQNIAAPKGESVHSAVTGVLLRLHQTEKTTSAQEQGNKYVFSVSPVANKLLIKRAVEARYNVVVNNVNVSNVPEKMRRRGRQRGWKSGWKKATVTLPEGQTIELE